MKPTIKINPNSGLAYISEDIRKEGYVGSVDCLPNAITLTLIRPGASYEDIRRSLKNVLEDLELRMKYHKEEKQKDAKKTKKKPAIMLDPATKRFKQS